jgi:3-mercaptopyruvate sulfurtransferase SseA
MDVTLDELRDRLGEEGLALVDVRSPLEFDGVAQAACDPRHGHIRGALNIPLETILECTSAEQVLTLVGLPKGTEVVAYCVTRASRPSRPRPVGSRRAGPGF